MNWRRSGSSYGFAQSISDSRYGDTRTDIGARAKPRSASAMNASDTSPRSAASSLGMFVIEFFACHLWSRNSASLTAA